MFTSLDRFTQSSARDAIFFRTADSLLRVATNEIASFCIDHRSRQMAVISSKAGRKGRLEIKMAFRYYVKQIDSMLPCV